MWVCVKFGFFVTDLHWNTAVITALKDKTQEKNKNCVCIGSGVSVCLWTLTFHFLLQWCQRCFSLQKTQGLRNNDRVCRWIATHSIYLLDSGPVFKDVNISQHVDDERACDTQRKRTSITIWNNMTNRKSEEGQNTYLKPAPLSSSSLTDPAGSSFYNFSPSSRRSTLEWECTT